MDSAVRTEDPSVWIEKTRIGGRDYKQEGALRLGQAVYSPSQNRAGHQTYETMRKAVVGDIVLHLLQDRQQIIGVSTIKSELEEDFEGIPEFDWTEEQRQAGGYRRWLTDYTDFDEPIDIYDDVLENSAYQDELRQIREDYTGLIYDKNLSLAEGFYFTRCPNELVEIFVHEQGPTLQEYLQRRGYAEIHNPRIPGTPSITSITAEATPCATAGVRPSTRPSHSPRPKHAPPDAVRTARSYTRVDRRRVPAHTAAVRLS